MASAATPRPTAHSSTYRRRVTKSARLSKNAAPRTVFGARSGSSESTAGSSVMEYAKAASTPNATRLPSTWNGGDSEAFRVRNAMAVVTDVRNTGCAFTRSDSMIASFRASPWRSPASVVVTMCMESATAMVRTMIGTPALTGLNTAPAQPASPMVVLIENIRSTTTAAAAMSERRSRTVTTTMTRNTTGVSCSRSSRVASAKARFMSTSPVR